MVDSYLSGFHICKTKKFKQKRPSEDGGSTVERVVQISRKGGFSKSTHRADNLAMTELYL